MGWVPSFLSVKANEKNLKMILPERAPGTVSHVKIIKAFKWSGRQSISKWPSLQGTWALKEKESLLLLSATVSEIDYKPERPDYKTIYRLKFFTMKVLSGCWSLNSFITVCRSWLFLKSKRNTFQRSWETAEMSHWYSCILNALVTLVISL